MKGAVFGFWILCVALATHAKVYFQSAGSTGNKTANRAESRCAGRQSTFLFAPSFI